ncbi:diaminopimelate decarboxylase [Marinilactibacillus sp. 15R]|uniref:Diaminopimelate decarboxylase n=1 Tax=Marinilactibacillus piezotolerans TaxID=258723 RepID=A0A1I3VPC0_9LACT|nr:MULTISPECIES: diaminopimelate decarboxylase [Marinilactibacillus]API89292.1 diaminopimelate decarboxylase [Marinilactibacillus sp. 15R]SFJ97238.1 diaminopimelate decarboxylase [Marinilactibacillus piezotolerans]
MSQSENQNIPYFPGTMKINEKNHLEIGGVDTVYLAEKYSTPLYVYDMNLIKSRLSEFKKAFSIYSKPTQVAYASKAFSSLALYQILAKEGVSLDVVSGGELHLAIKAGFPAAKIHFHGNNKSHQELVEALNYNIGCIVIDNFTELDMINQLTTLHQKNINVLIRITPGIEAHTHEYITTGQEDSKFGFDLASGQAEKAIKTALDCAYINVIGLHAHIGSQIFETDGYKAVIERLMQHAKQWKEQTDFDLKVLNVGGGFGIRYTKADEPLSIKDYALSIVESVEKNSADLHLELPEIWVEPGRSIVGEAGTTLYTIGTEKNIPEIRRYISVDGGMADNIRPALYEAEYTGVLANKVYAQYDTTVSIAGKACESGDMLIWDLALPEVEQGDYLAVLSTGAYGYSMASNYNRLPRPAVVFVENRQDFLAIKRESYDDFMRLENPIADSI